MGNKTRDGDDDSDELAKVTHTNEAIRAARQHVLELEQRLQWLQQQLLARGTRKDVLRQAREAIDATVKEVEDDLRNEN